MKRYRVEWEEKVGTIVKAKNEGDAIDRIMNGEFDGEVYSKEITCPPEEATEIKE